MIDKRYWKETRTLGAVGFFMERFRAVLASMIRSYGRQIPGCIEQSFDACFDSSGISRVLFLLVRSLLSGNISAGAFAAVFTSIDSIFRFMENIVARSAGNIHDTWRQ